MSLPFDAIIFVSFGGPEGRDEVIPFLENVLRGRNVPRERMLEVAEHYYHFDGVSPINAQNRDLIEAVKRELAGRGVHIPIYFGNRNWRPMLTDAFKQMEADGIQNVIAFVTSALSSYSGCRQYRENMADAQKLCGASAPKVAKLRVFFNHPRFVACMVDRVNEALEKIPQPERASAHLVFTAHSIPQAMAANCKYEVQLREACRLVAEGVGHRDYRVAFQSRSGPPTQPWLEPDIGDVVREIGAGEGSKRLVCCPIGFISDHMEVLYDLDDEAAQIAKDVGVHFVRAGTAGTHPEFVRMVADLIIERMNEGSERPAIGLMGPNHDVCPEDCCRYEPRRPS